jgi:hypothetical protein
MARGLILGTSSDAAHSAGNGISPAPARPDTEHAAIVLAAVKDERPSGARKSGHP